MTSIHLYIKKDLYFAPKIKRSDIFLGGPVIGTFKKLSCERKLGLYFSLRTSLVLKIFSWSSHLKGVFSRGNSDYLCLVCMPNVCGVCGWFISIGILTKMFCKNKNSSINNNNWSQKQSKKLKKENSNNNHEKRKIVCLRHDISTKNNLTKSLWHCVWGNWALLFQGFLTKATSKNVD